MSVPILSIIAAENDPSVQGLLKDCITELGFKCLGFVDKTSDAIERIKVQKPSIFLMNFDMPGTPALEVIRQSARLGTTAIIAMTAPGDKVAPQKAMDAGASGFIRKPFELSHMDIVLENSWHRFHSKKQFETQIATLNQRLDLRKLVEKAKGILMKEERINEFEAHKLLLRMSQEKSIPLKSICQSLITLRTALKPLKNRQNSADLI